MYKAAQRFQRQLTCNMLLHCRLKFENPEKMLPNFHVERELQFNV